MQNRYYLFSMDALVCGGRPCRGAGELLTYLRVHGCAYVILTEQCGKTRAEIARTMNEIGFRDICEDDIYTSSLAAVDWIRWMYPEADRAVMFGGRGMRTALESGQIEISHVDANWLFLGMNTDLTYADYCDALQVIDAGASLIVTDERRTMIKEGDRTIGNGAVAQMLAYAADCSMIHFGRGSERFLKQAVKYFDVPLSDLTMVGTHFKKDIIPAVKMGISTVYVTHGASIMDLGMNEECHPDYIVEDLFGLMK